MKGETVLGVVSRQRCCFLVPALAYPDVEEKPVLYSHLWRSAVVAALGLGEVSYENSEFLVLCDFGWAGLEDCKEQPGGLD